MRLFKIILPLLLCAGLGACSIKEDRADCPCVLELSVDGGDLDRDIISVWDGGLRLRDTLHTGGGKSSFNIEIPKGFPVLSVMSGTEVCETEISLLTVPFGEEMKEVYAWAEKVDSRCETISRQAVLHRQYAYIHLNVIFQNGEDSPFVLRLRSNVCGMDLATLAPVPGPFEVSFMPVVGSYHRICVPRQIDDSMMLDFIPRDASVQYGFDSLPLGRYLEETGFDWSAPDLTDVYLDIDYVKALVTVSVEEWKEGKTVDLVI